MNRILTTALTLTALAITPAMAQEQTVHSRSGERESYAGPVENFTGTVTVTPLFGASDLSNATGSLVEFTPGARSAWHTHPAGQTLIVTSGVGWTQNEGGEKITIRAGDVIECPPKLRHWHGATPTSSMSHIAITPVHEESAVEWLEHVTDEQYLQ